MVMPYTSVVAEMAQQINNAYGSPIIFGTVTGIEGLETRSIVEVQLADGSMTNAVAWTQALIRPGDQVVLAHTQRSDGTIYSIVAINAPALGMDPMTRDTQPFTELWKGTPLRPTQIPTTVGEIYLFKETSQTVLLNIETYAKMRIDIEFSFPPALSVVRYWLYGWSPVTTTFDIDPDFQLEIGTSYVSDDGRLLRTVFNMDAAGELGDFLFDALDANFCIAIERLTSATVRGSAIGKIRAAGIAFLQDHVMEPMRCSARSRCTVSSIDAELIACQMSATGTLAVNQWWNQITSKCSVDAVVMGPA